MARFYIKGRERQARCALCTITVLSSNVLYPLVLFQWPQYSVQLKMKRLSVSI